MADSKEAQLTPEQIARAKPLLQRRATNAQGIGCFACKWILEDLEKNGALTDHPKGPMGGQFPASGKLIHLKIENML